MRRARVAAILIGLAMTVSTYAADKVFDPTRDSAKDLKAAVEQARAEHKNILMMSVGTGARGALCWIGR